MSQKTDKGQQDVDQKIFVDLHGFTASVSKQSMETVKHLFAFVFVLFCFVFPPLNRNEGSQSVLAIC